MKHKDSAQSTATTTVHAYEAGWRQRGRHSWLATGEFPIYACHFVTQSCALVVRQKSIRFNKSSDGPCHYLLRAESAPLISLRGSCQPLLYN